LHHIVSHTLLLYLQAILDRYLPRWQCENTGLLVAELHGLQRKQVPIQKSPFFKDCCQQGCCSTMIWPFWICWPTGR
jgi:hypothetical protein